MILNTYVTRHCKRTKYVNKKIINNTIIIKFRLALTLYADGCIRSPNTIYV